MWVYIKDIALNSNLFNTGFFYRSCFAIHKMVEIEYSMDIYKSVKISIGTVMKNPVMLEFVPDHLKTKKCVKMHLKNYLS